jgi:tRNA-specific 2-thiouridylase
MVRVAVLSSGGVDSSVALCRLAEAGEHRLTAFYLKIWLEDDMAFLGSCPWEEDLAHVQAICRALRVPLEIVSLQQEYLSSVVGYTIEELEAGRTPSPDVMCNRFIKFGAFVDRIGDDFELVASGHYARRESRAGLSQLLCGVDPVKDQTYFLSQMTQQQLQRSLFPIGELTKPEVRAEARRYGLPNQDRPESQGICFLGRIPYDDFIAFHLGERPGEIRELGTDRVLGSHRGFWFYTIGQRRGLGLAGGPWYVASKDVETNTIHVVHAERLAGHYRSSFRIPRPNWIAAVPSSSRLAVRIRHGARMIDCDLRILSGGEVEVELDEGDPGIAPGQFAVLYDGEKCLGGGAIEWRKGSVVRA